MIVVADSSPLIVLFKIGCINVLPSLFGTIMAPPAVFGELQNPQRDPGASAYFSAKPAWMVVAAPLQAISVQGLHPGETEAIALAKERAADLLLVDDRRAFRYAVAQNINAIGTIRLLELAAEQSLVDLAASFDALKRVNFWVDHRLLDQRLVLWKQKNGGRNP